MKLSEAILLGGMSTPQIQGRLYNDNGGTCAMGGAYQAIGKLEEIKDNFFAEFEIMQDEFPFSFKSGFRCVLCNWLGNIGQIVAHLNDDHSWTRAQISEWVAQQEAKWESEEAEKGAECTMALMGKESL